MVRTRSAALSGSLDDLRSLGEFGVLDGAVGELAFKVYEELNITGEAYGSGAIVDLIPHMVEILNTLNEKLLLVNSLQSQMSLLQMENGQLSQKLLLEKDRCSLVLEETVTIENEIEFVQRENRRLESKVEKLRRELANKASLNGCPSSSGALVGEPLVFVNRGIQTDRTSCGMCHRHTLYFQQPYDDTLGIVTEQDPEINNIGNNLEKQHINSDLENNLSQSNMNKDPQISCKSSSNHEVLENQIALKNKGTSGCAGSNISDGSSGINLFMYSDSHGRGLVENLRKHKRNLKVYSVVKPGAGFLEVVKGISNQLNRFKSNDIILLYGGSNDIPHTGTEQFIKSLKNQLASLLCVDVILFNLPHRYDLPHWSYINHRIKMVNNKIFKICNDFRNVKVLNVNGLGRRFYTTHGMHFNAIGKKLISDMILAHVESLLARFREGATGRCPALSGCSKEATVFNCSTPVGRSEHKCPTSSRSGEKDNAGSSFTPLSSQKCMAGLAENHLIVHDVTQGDSSNSSDMAQLSQDGIALSPKPSVVSCSGDRSGAFLGFDCSVGVINDEFSNTKGVNSDLIKSKPLLRWLKTGSCMPDKNNSRRSFL